MKTFLTSQEWQICTWRMETSRVVWISGSYDKSRTNFYLTYQAFFYHPISINFIKLYCFLSSCELKFSATHNDTSYKLTEDHNQTSLGAYLCEKDPDYISVVPNHWLSQDQPVPDIQTYTSIYLLILCVSGNISQLLVMTAFKR